MIKKFRFWLFKLLPKYEFQWKCSTTKRLRLYQHIHMRSNNDKVVFQIFRIWMQKIREVIIHLLCDNSFNLCAIKFCPLWFHALEWNAESFFKESCHFLPIRLSIILWFVWFAVAGFANCSFSVSTFLIDVLGLMNLSICNTQ